MKKIQWIGLFCVFIFSALSVHKIFFGNQLPQDMIAIQEKLATRHPASTSSLNKNQYELIHCSSRQVVETTHQTIALIGKLCERKEPKVSLKYPSRSKKVSIKTRKPQFFLTEPIYLKSKRTKVSIQFPNQKIDVEIRMK